MHAKEASPILQIFKKKLFINIQNVWVFDKTKKLCIDFYRF